MIKRVEQYSLNNEKLKKPRVKEELSMDTLKTSVKDIIDTMKHYEGSSFLTSNQINVPGRIAVLDLKSIFQKDEYSQEDRYLVMVNPELIETSKDQIKITETSLSTPMYQSPSTRSASCTVEFQNLKFKTLPEEIPTEVVTDTTTEVNTTEVQIVTNKIDFDNFELNTERLTYWERVAFVAQAAIDQLNGKTYLDNLSWYNRNLYFKNLKRVKSKFKKMILNGALKLGS